MAGEVFRFDRIALERMLRNSGFMKQVGDAVRDEARDNVPASLKHDTSDPEQAIVSKVGLDTLGAYVDIGYDKEHPGFYLWWWEVGTKKHAPIPHLRPALRFGVIDRIGTAAAGGAASELVDYTTRAGVTRQATRAQVANWTRGSR